LHICFSAEFVGAVILLWIVRLVTGGRAAA
jgi:uncharacterized membrane protein YeaQ/YmgE (transglycosylase-associated protein family)